MSQIDRFNQLLSQSQSAGGLKTRLVRAAAFTSISGFFDFAIRIGSVSVLARLLTPEHFGLVMMVSAFTAIVDQLREMGLSSATVQKRDITHEEVSNLFWCNVGVGLMFTGLVSATSPLIASYYKEDRLIAITCALAVNFLIGGLFIQHQALLTRQMRMRDIAAIRLLASIISTAVAILMAYRGYGYWALVWREIIRSMILAGGFWLCFPWIPGLPYRNTSVRGLLKFGANLTGANIVGSVASGLDRFLIGRFWGAGQVGMYRQAFQLISAPSDQLLSALYQVAQPGLSMLQSDPTRYAGFFRRILTLVASTTMPLSLFVAVFSEDVSSVLLGAKWVGAAEILFILSLGTYIKQPIGCTAFVLITRGQSGTYFMLTLVSHFVTALAICVGVQWGAPGVAWADVAATYLLFAPRVFYSLRNSPVLIGSYLSALLRPMASSILMAVTFWVAKSFTFVQELPAPARLATGVPVCILLFGGFWLMIPGGRAEAMKLYTEIVEAMKRRKAR